jgi:hypothetical protein
MRHPGFFDLEQRLQALSAKGDPLETIKRTVRWEDFRADIEAATKTKPEEKRSNAGRKPYDTILKFKVLVLQSLHNLSDEQTGFLIRDRISKHLGRVLRQLGNRPLLPSWPAREIKRFDPAGSPDLCQRTSAIAATAIFAPPCGQRRFFKRLKLFEGRGRAF